ncbi:hypothetical protein F441_15077 [Phytophthora nicotianae CJ01A1]|uniref:RxLR effector protein n=5 Tax=Phytophthora nicotianae TaxID=4792 RepID=V9EM11_PHYNI|nr:hypothetical protein F443_15266 [Phytophthora nicotianae P1569]ETK79324.1 hypothetical protein L915_14808 [Phytophthora nicotianae]ETO67864.1 hypothetical protein F444_15254 [Phytophthora nicotianae P1976]ETP09026.1 hypothetical protein F441_15077 [Phytophthora nicotianae CJ01A1]ETP37057.1 hypothetical protein F442_15104 [Phytophthora nicotianae P10297]
MRLYFCVLLLVLTLFASGTAIPLSADKQPPAFKTSDRRNRNLRVNENAPENVITEERGPNVDIIIKDTASKVNKATFRKLKFFVWKYLMRVTTQDARKKLGMELMGREVYGHKNHGQFMDYAKYYGKL